MATSQTDMIVGRLRNFAEAQQWQLTGMDLRGEKIVLTFEHDKPATAPATPGSPQTILSERPG